MRRAIPPGLAFAGMVLTPLARQGGEIRRAAAGVVVGGLAATTFDRLSHRHGGARAAVAAAGVTATGWAAERVGTRTGLPFGRYAYSGRLRPVLGGVPVLVPLAWFAMAAPARETAHGALGRWSTPGRRIALGAVALTAWDVFLDPQMVGEGYWSWAQPGRYRGVPASNFVGWLVTSAAAMALLELAVPPSRNRDRSQRVGDDPDGGLVGTYAGVAAMETLGFALFFRDRLVATAGGVAMLPLAAVAVVRSLRRGRLAP